MPWSTKFVWVTILTCLTWSSITWMKPGPPTEEEYNKKAVLWSRPIMDNNWLSDGRELESMFTDARGPQRLRPVRGLLGRRPAAGVGVWRPHGAALGWRDGRAAAEARNWLFSLSAVIQPWWTASHYSLRRYFFTPFSISYYSNTYLVGILYASWQVLGHCEWYWYTLDSFRISTNLFCCSKADCCYWMIFRSSSYNEFDP